MSREQMELAHAIGMAALLTGVVGLAARLCVESDVLDDLILIGACVGIGFLLGAP